MAKITGKTKSGFEFSYDERILTDWEYLTLLRKLTSDDGSVSNTEKLAVTQDMFTVLLGEEQTKKLIEHVRKNNDGFATIEAITEEFNEVIQLKN